MISRISSPTSHRCQQRLTAFLVNQRWNGHRASKLVAAVSTPTTRIRPLEREQVQWYSRTLHVLKSSVVQHDEDIVEQAPEEEINKVERTVEEMYSRKTPLEHVLLRPGMYVGAVERLPPNQCWVVDRTFPPPASSGSITQPQNETSDRPMMKMVRKDYGIVPALIKVFDEILVNASDNRLRHPGKCSAIDVVIDAGSVDRDPFISIYNDGKGVPVEASCGS